MRLTDIDKDGRRKSEPTGKYEILKADSVIVAIGEEVDKKWFTENKIQKNKSNNIEIDDNIYIVGDCLNGPSSVVESIADSKKAAESILSKNKINEEIFSQYIPIDNLKLIDEKCLIERGKLKKETKEDCSRCLACNQYCGRCVDVCPNRANRAIGYSSDDLQNIFQIVHLDYLCNECGNCQTFCPYDGSPYKEKFTIFSTYEKFKNSKNKGIFVKFEKEKDKLKFLLRTQDDKLIEIIAKNIEGLYKTSEKSTEIDFSLFLINNYPEIFKNNYDFSIGF